MSSTYQIGTMVAAMVAARLWGFDVPTTTHALGIAYGQAAGNQQGLLNGALAVRVQQGLSTSAGLLAALLAGRGVTGPADALEGRFGYYPTYWGGRYSRDPIVDGLGTRFLVRDEVSIKPYPCCKYNHTSVAAARRARGDRALRADDIARVVVHVDNEEYYSVVCDPEAPKRRPSTTVDAQFSIYYSVAVALLGGPMDIADFQEPLIGDPERLAVAAKVEAVVGSGGSTGGRALPTPGFVEVELVDGTVLEGRARVAPGHPDDPLDWDGVMSKFRSVTAHPPLPFPDGRGDQLLEVVRDLDRRSDAARDLFDLLSWR
jgi:2-methylcitrate dehydratase PrpD